MPTKRSTKIQTIPFRVIISYVHLEITARLDWAFFGTDQRELVTHLRKKSRARSLRRPNLVNTFIREFIVYSFAWTFAENSQVFRERICIATTNWILEEGIFEIVNHFNRGSHT